MPISVCLLKYSISIIIMNHLISNKTTNRSKHVIYAILSAFEICQYL